MTKERIIADSKNYLISVHDTLRRAFRNEPPERQDSINGVLKDIEQDVKVLEILESDYKILNRKQDRKKEMITEE